MKGLVRGGVASSIATIAMSVVMFAGKRAGLLKTPSPKEILGRAAQQTDSVPLPHSTKSFDITWLAAHAGYGASAGVVYAIVRPILPGTTVLPGLLYGAGLWGFGCLGILPTLGLYPWPSEDSDSRKAVMIAAHLAYGTTVALCARAENDS